MANAADANGNNGASSDYLQPEKEGGEGGAEEEDVRAFQETCRQEMERRLSNLQGNFNLAIDDSEFGDLAERFHSQNRVQIATRQVDVLRTNKIFRDVARFMGGTDWRPLFQRLVEALPTDVVAAEVVRVEREKAFMQPYKALTVWKELSGENFRIEALVEALHACGLNDLAERTLATLQSEGDSLYSLSDFGKSNPARQASTSGRKVSASGSSGATGEAGEPGGRKLSSQTSTEPASASAGGGTTEGLGDGQLLRLARKIGGQWVSLGKALNLPSDQIKEIWEKEGDTYQGAFQMLWAWRDVTCTLSLADAVSGLATALAQISRTDLAVEVKKWL